MKWFPEGRNEVSSSIEVWFHHSDWILTEERIINIIMMDINIIKMGICVSSRNLYAGASSLYEVARWEEDFAAMQLAPNDVERLHQVFERIDKDDSRNIELIELISLLDIDRTAFSERIFSIFDENKTGSINFYQFVVTLWNYCTLSDDSLRKYFIL